MQSHFPKPSHSITGYGSPLRLFSDIPQILPLDTGEMIPALDPMPVHLEDYDLFLKGGEVT